MNVDFMHNQIIRDTVTPRFIESFNDNLVPYLISQYGTMLEEIQFYEDHLTSGLRIGGEFFYPLTIVVNGIPKTRAVKWQVSNYRHYDKFNPFSYKGTEPLEFTLLDEIPEAVAAAIENKSIYADTGAAVPVVLTSASDDKIFLAGKYSQGFVDVFARAMTRVIESELGIKGLAESGVVLEFRFAPGTFMEHIVANTTYRRVLIKARGCAARDLWVKWTRLDGNGTYTISDNVSDDEIEFALAEDVPGKIREKEYRYLTAESTEKYQSAMGRKNITEWREMMRRVIRRGEVEKLDTVQDEKLTPPELEEEKIVEEIVEEEKPLAIDKLAAILSEDIDGLDDAPAGDEDDDLSALLKSAIGLTASVATKADETEPAVYEPEYTEEVDEDEEPVYEEDVKYDDEPVKVVADPALEARLAEERIRYEIEQKLRAEMEAEIKRKEAEAEELRIRLEEKLRAEAREKELLAAEARAALLEQKRLEKEREEAEARAREEAALRAEEEARRAEEEARREQIRKEEEARIRAEMEAKAKAEAEARAEAEKAAQEEINYVSKTVKLFFKQQIDPSITKRIHEIILATIKYYHKEDVYIKVKANIPDITTVNLQFVKIPENEIPLLVNIIKVLGRSDLGITRAVLD